MTYQKKKKKQDQTLKLLAIGLAALLLVGLVTMVWLAENEGEMPSPVETAPKIPSNAYELDAFYKNGDLMCYSAGEYLAGIDVSAHQGVIQWQQVKEAGVEFAVIRAGYRGSTEGRLYEDEQFQYNMEGAAAVEIPVGIYFYSQALNTEEALEEAAYVCGLLEAYDVELPVFFDWEYGGSGGRISSIEAVPLTECAIAFCEFVEAQGYAAGVYFNQTFGYHHFDLLQLQDYTLWLAEYNEAPTFRYHFDWLQYSDNGFVTGIEVPVDLDIILMEKTVTSTDFVVVDGTTEAS